MLVPLSWLRDYVPLPADPAALVERLTIAGLESSGVKVFGLPVPDGIRVKPEDAGLVWETRQGRRREGARDQQAPGRGQAEAREARLRRGRTEDGRHRRDEHRARPERDEGRSSACAARKYFYTDKDGKKTIFTLEPKALRGIMNDAMCMSNFELGISDEHEGIILLDDADPAPGTPVADMLGEIVVELDVLPNMARCLSMIGIAREVAALTGAAPTIAEPKAETVAEKIDGKVAVEIDDPKLCPRYTATVIRNVTVGPAPRWMQSRLQYAGMRPINNVVDITNYVMLEYGQPLHAFDYDVLVKRAGGQVADDHRSPREAGEKLKTLDGQDRELSPENLVIADTVGADRAGRRHGRARNRSDRDDEDDPARIGGFDFVSVRKTARQFNLFSEASTRFSRGVHPDLAKPAATARRSCSASTPAARCSRASSTTTRPRPPPQVIELHRSRDRAAARLRRPDGEVERVLTALQFQVKPETFGWTVTAPRTRLDIQAGAADLIEELARVYGYDKLPERLLPLELPEPKGNRALELEDKVRDLLADQGLQEAITYSLTSAGGRGEAAAVSPARTRHAAEPDLARALRDAAHRCCPACSRSSQRTSKPTDSVAMFELGFVYLPKAGEKLPDEPRRLAIVLCGRRAVGRVGRPARREAARSTTSSTSRASSNRSPPTCTCRACRSRPRRRSPWLHPGRSAELIVNGKAVGAFGELHPKVAASFGLGERAVLVAELDLEAILAAVPERFAYKPFSTFPPAKRDVAVVVPPTRRPRRCWPRFAPRAATCSSRAELFDVYTGEGIPAGTKSLAFALTYQAPDRTLGEKEIAKAHEKVEGRLRHVLKAQIRGKD